MNNIVAYNDFKEDVEPNKEHKINISSVDENTNKNVFNKQDMFNNITHLDSGFGMNSWPCRGTDQCNYFNPANKLINNNWRLIDILSLPNH